MTTLFKLLFELIHALFVAPFLKVKDDEAIRDVEVHDLDEGEPDDDEPWQPSPVIPDEKPVAPPVPTIEPKEEAKIIVIPPRLEEVEIEEPGKMLTGAWAGMASMVNPSKTVAFCKANNIGRLDVIINDHSKWRTQQAFSMWDKGKISGLVEAAKSAGIEVHLMSWIMPHQKYLETAAEILVPFCNEIGVKSIQWDAEEPWTQAKNRMKYTEAAKMLSDLFAGLDCEMGANAIGFTPTSKFGPLTEVVDYIVPQCYSTVSSGITPETVVPRLVRRWESVFGKKRMAIGLAAYRQNGIKGHTISSALRAAYAGAEAIEGVDSVIYWSLRWIQKNKTVARTIRELSVPEEPTIILAA